MTENPSFVDQTITTIALWHGITPPNPIALAMVEDLGKTIADFAALRGSMRFEDEPSSFTAALQTAAAVEVTP